ncbi:calcium-binding protein [Mesorhizobium plurifarium]|uniref:SMc04171 family calcium-binding repeat protein n=1 Tax=Sinorhizobium arboris TaxID=76745 RepID=UPI0003F95E38|nr:calcium-binding protein [Sinorhizobium arboris]PST21978.1 calcium-binding protein [Mesorhizobium plurifarium]
MTTVVGTAGDDTLSGTEEKDRIWGLSGADEIEAGGGDDLVDGGAGNDRLTSRSGYDRLDGGEGDDLISLIGTGGAVTGGAGVDTLVVDLSSVSSDVRFSGEHGHGIIGYNTANWEHIFFNRIERLVLTTGSGNDRIFGAATDDIISTGAGNDIVGPYGVDGDDGTSMLGDDAIDTGSGGDIINDTVGANRIFAGDHNDIIITTLSSAVIDGGSGWDRLSMFDEGRTDDVTIDFGRGVASTGTLISGIEVASVDLGSGSDTLIAGNLSSLTAHMGEGDNYVTGSSGRDYIASGSGDDALYGGAGDDILISAGGHDVLVGGDGNDEIYGGTRFGDGEIVIDGGAGDDLIQVTAPSGFIDGGSGSDTLRVVDPLPCTNFDASTGMLGTSLIFTNIERFELSGGSGNDAIRTLAGDDQLAGNDGNDRLDAGGGNDLLWGGAGDDVMTGGAGADTFLWSSDTVSFAGVDRITDFDTDGGDLLRFIGYAHDTTRIDSFADLIAAATETEDGLYIAFNGSDTFGLLLDNVSLADLSADDVVFV